MAVIGSTAAEGISTYLTQIRLFSSHLKMEIVLPTQPSYDKKILTKN